MKTTNTDFLSTKQPNPYCRVVGVNGSTSLVFNEDYKHITHTYPDKYFDWAICDIPYGINVGRMAFLSETNNFVKQKNGTKLRAKNKKHTLKDWDKEFPPQEYFDELRRISKNQIIFGADYTDWSGLGTGRIKWDKGFPDGVSFNQYEHAYCSAINHEIEIKLLWAGMMQAKSLKEPMTQQGNKKLNEKRIHPCHKPIMLYDAIFKQFGIENMKVIDTHLGSGSIRITADKFNCEFVGCEIDSEYFSDHEKRWFNYRRNLKLAF